MGVRKLKKLKGDNEVNRHSYCRKKCCPLGWRSKKGWRLWELRAQSRSSTEWDPGPWEGCASHWCPRRG